LYYSVNVRMREVRREHTTIFSFVRSAGLDSTAFGTYGHHERHNPCADYCRAESELYVN
jgi:hypothetical protein